jgi:hypothetical protein
LIESERVLILTTSLVLLNGWTRHIAIATIDATITIFGLQNGFTLLTFIKELTSVGRHGFYFLMTTAWAGDFRLQNDSGHHSFIFLL